MELKLKCNDINFDGTGKVFYNEKEYSVNDILSGEEGIFEVKGKKLELKKLISKSSSRIDVKCPIFSKCGGCQYLNISYDDEMKLKNNYFNSLFNGIKTKEKKEVIGMFDPYNYRNKCQMVYKLSKTKKVVSGFYEENTHNIIPVEECLLHAKPANRIIKEVNTILSQNKILPYDEKTRTGVIRHILIRYGFFSKQIMVVLVTNGEVFPGRRNVINALIEKKLGITTIVQNYNQRDTSIVLGDKERVLYGAGYIYDYIGDYKFKISSRSFYQVNSVGMKRLYSRAIELADISKNDIVIDAYSGVGTIGIFASKYAKYVYEVEQNHDAVIDAKTNIKINGIKNVEIIEEDATKFMQNLAKGREKIDVLIMDPPRSGSTKQFINTLAYTSPKRVIYISCEPTTLKRDLFDFFDNGYVVKAIEGFDMFPRTFNIETICVLERKDGLK